MRKTILQEHESCSVQKTARKNTKYSKDETILKISHLAKAIDLTKWTLSQKLEMPKTCENHFTRRLKLFCSKPALKNPNI